MYIKQQQPINDNKGLLLPDPIYKLTVIDCLHNKQREQIAGIL